MRRTVNNIILIMLLLFCNLVSGLAQRESEPRNVIITAPDSVIKTSIQNKSFTGKILESGTYFWYYAGRINHNQGGFSGKLLHGKYEVFDNQQRLLTMGSFLNGLKEGSWIRWTRSGKMQVSCSFRKGKLDGSLKTFTITGNLLTESNYTNDLLDGSSKYYLKDTVIIKKYRMGKEVPVENHRKLFSKTKTTSSENDSKLSNKENAKKPGAHRKLFSGLKRKSSEKKENEDNSKTLVK
jgi:antitoxin component YwqK of YwqJK toxin-antitoxin module